MAKEIILTVRDEFDRIILMLRDDFQIPFSMEFARKMLVSWASIEGYLYSGAHLRNIPWMLPYLSESLPLFGQKVTACPEIASAIRERVRGAGIDEHGRLTKGSGYFDIAMNCLRHRIVLDDRGTVHESFKMLVADFSAAGDPRDAPVLHQKIIEFRPDRFEALINTRSERAVRDRRLLALAEEVLGDARLLDR